MQSSNKIEQIMDIVSTLSSGELLEAFIRFKSLYEVSLPTNDVRTAEGDASIFFNVDSNDYSLLMDQRLDLDDSTVTIDEIDSSSFINVNSDESLPIDQHLDLGDSTVTIDEADSSIFISVDSNASSLMDQQMDLGDVTITVPTSSSFGLHTDPDQTLLTEEIEPLLKSAPVAAISYTATVPRVATVPQVTTVSRVVKVTRAPTIAELRARQDA